ncbi:nitrogenase component 1 [Desulfobulbus elongatus]|uniref:nitrogenase component 1 n=1 Tax=Desulfobulbus elongatus TaxID=53332 RepID=UPI000483E9DA|nr:nitrogenase component 1 [Desulfobulbus elongatus]
MKIAIYGKGGIGKSTVTANLAAALAAEGRRVLQIGCDPKHDSTRLLLGGRVTTTILDFMREVPPMEQRLDRILHQGYGGVVCAEAGGPEPGIGCAGRGILSAFALFDRLGLRSDDFDVVLYDVLGDVVCGGFAVPLRQGFADVVYIVTSEEFMAVYAANNILRGVGNFEQNGPRLAGLILNSRGDGENPEPVRRFAQAVGLPIVCHLPRSDRFRRAETRHQTLVQAFPTAPETGLFRELARRALDPGPLHPARPLPEAGLEAAIFGTGSSGFVQPGRTGEPRPSRPAADDIPTTAGLPTLPPPPALRLSKSMLCREPLHGCAFAGAIGITVQIRDGITVAHGPRSCAHIASRAILASGIHSRIRRNRLLPRQLAPALISSDMNEGVVIHGGTDKLTHTLHQALALRPRAVFVVTTCPSGVIGDDPAAAIRAVTTGRTPPRLLPIATDGNLAGDYMQGVINACIEGAAALIDRSVRPEGNRVNILAEKNIANNAETNFEIVSDLLKHLGIAVNCRFVRNASVAELRRFRRAPLNLLAHEDHFGRVLRDYFREHHQAVFAAHPFPVGMTETERWLMDIARFFGKTESAAALLATHRQRYRALAQGLRPRLAGTKLMIVSYGHDIDWLLEAAFDTGMDVVRVGILNSSQDDLFRTRFTGRFSWATGYTREQRDADLLRLRPDLLLCNYIPTELPVAVRADSIPLCPDVGCYSGLALARRWVDLLKTPLREGWRDDA